MVAIKWAVWWGGFNPVEDIYRFPEPIIHLTRDYEDQVMASSSPFGRNV